MIFGIDGGGTGCRAVVCDQRGVRLGMGGAGPANIMTGLDLARNNIIEACSQALADAGLPKSRLDGANAFLGVAGANIGTYAEQIVNGLPFANCIVGSDAVAALQGAIGDSDGVVAIIGTGSVFISRSSGKIRTVGGWGFMVGDLGSGARLGRSLLQEALLVYDGVHQRSPLTNHVLEHFRNNPQTIVEYAHAARPGEFGTFAPLILEFAEKKDPTARVFLDEAIQDVEETLDAILVGENQRLCLLGGLGKRYAPMLADTYQARLVAASGSAVDGAVDLAIKRFVSPHGGPSR
ncbi:MAG: BadF/BadG/BcrA/BcrD ATPase family protein [Hoeflea sp.]|uniref:BadF/BadG/BcrA/BcrD ATPase family protein n=1 Tax=Hoeflea sp. TaxID=1940281 RepID=UPI003EF5427E